jgi:hypothetical protein
MKQHMKRKADAPTLMKGQTKEERQGIRKKQREVRDFIESNKEEIGNVGSDGFEKAREANNDIGDQVAFMREAVLDGQNLKSLALATTKQAQRLAIVNQAVTVENIIKELRKKNTKEGEDVGFRWLQIGGHVGHLYGSVASTDFLCGPVGKPPPTRKERKKRGEVAAEEEGEATKSEEMKVQQGEQKESTQVRIGDQYELLKATVPSRNIGGIGTPGPAVGEEGVDFFSFLVDPASYTQTVENVFDLSFLVKQGKTAVHLDEYGLPVLIPCEGLSAFPFDYIPLSVFFFLPDF